MNFEAMNLFLVMGGVAGLFVSAIRKAFGGRMIGSCFFGIVGAIAGGELLGRHMLRLGTGGLDAIGGGIVMLILAVLGSIFFAFLFTQFTQTR